MELVLIRTYQLKGTNGQLYAAGEKFCDTIELPWKENQRQVSCIPEGRYELRRRYTPKFGYHFLLREVPGRSNILIHAFNDAMAESRGCIAPVSQLSGEGRGHYSRLALARMVTLLYPELRQGKPIFLTIQSAS